MKRGGGGGRGGAGADGRSGASGGSGRRAPAGRGRDARDVRVAWPPQQRPSAREAIEELMRERGLPRRFEGAVEHGARRARAGGLNLPVGGPPRRDLRELPTFTIDPASARDFDDAVSAERIHGGRAVRVRVHIADVSAHVREGSPLDVEARLRATSVYVPGAVEPMLPPALSSDACSLLPACDRPAVTVEFEVPLDGAAPERGAEAAPEGAAASSAAGDEAVRSAEATGAGGATAPRFYRSLIRSDARLDYDQVDLIFAGTHPAAEPWAEPLAAARAAARALGHARSRRPGNLFVDSDEPEFEFDERGEVTAIRARPQTESHRLVEHLMIAANEAVAQTLRDNAVPTLYRVHERPHVESVLRLLDQLASLDVPTPPVPDGLTRAGAAELLGEISRRVERHVQRTAARARAGDRSVSPTGGRRALTALVLRSLQQAHYSPRNLGHAGLGSPCYCHFTSPIRRYPDLVCHRALLSLLGHAEHAPRASHLEELGVWCSERERAAIEIERDADDVARCFALERLLYREGPDRVFAGEVVGLIGAGAFVAFGAHSPAGGHPASGAHPTAGAHPAPADGQVGGYSYEGLLPVRLLSALAVAREGEGAREASPSSAAAAAAAARAEGRAVPAPRAAAPARAAPGRAVPVDRANARGARGRGQRSPQAARDWWELGEEGTTLRGQRTGATLRLGDPIAVRVERVDAPRGRVDLLPAALAPTEPAAPSASPAPSASSAGSAGSRSSGRRGGSARGGPARGGSARGGPRGGKGRGGPRGGEGRGGPRGGQGRGGRGR